MGSRDPIESFTSGLPRPVDVAAIERQLAELWQSAGAAEPGGAVVRATLLNLIFFAPPDAISAAETVTRVATQLPCRALVVEVAPPAPGAPALEAWIAAHCRAGGPEGKQVCCEQVTIRAAPSALDGLPSTLLALLVPDLPTVVCWLARPDLGGALLARLGCCADRLVVDSAEFVSVERDLGHLDALRGGEHPIEVSDLAWARLDPWRGLLAALFDGPRFLASLRTLSGATIAHAPGARHEALLSAGWLASRLGWRRAQDERDGWRMQTEHGSVRLRTLVAAADARLDATRPGLRRLELETRDGTRFVVEPDVEHPSLLVGRVECEGTCPLPQRLDRTRLDPDAELLQILMRAHRNVAYEDALAAAARLCGPATEPA